MARIRSIKPEFWEAEEIGILSRDARLLYIATWNLADDEGLLRWSSAYLKANAFIYDTDLSTEAIERLMKELTDQQLVVSYKGGRSQLSLGWIPSFHKHQRPNRPQPSKLPPPSLQNPAIRTAYADRDGWICSECTEQITPELIGNTFDGGKSAASHSLSLDHDVPRSEGGSDFPSNIRITHSMCNSRKATRNHSVIGSVNDSPTSPDPLTAGTGTGEGEGIGEGGGGTEGDSAGKPPRRRLNIEKARWKPTLEQLEWAADEFPDVDLTTETEKFIDHFTANGKPMKDWDAAWRNWMRRAPTFVRADR